MPTTVELMLLDGGYAVTLLPPGSALPDWVSGPGFVTVSDCDDELSIVTRGDRVPADLPKGGKTDKGWRALKLTGAFDFDQPGIVLSVVRPISEAGLAVFVVSTFHRDYLLVRTDRLEQVRGLLEAVGHSWV